MKMNNYINDFTNHLREAMDIGKSAELNKSDKKFSNILICGLGGSGIGGTIVNDIVSPFSNIPILVTKDYSIPNFVDENTLVIASFHPAFLMRQPDQKKLSWIDLKMIKKKILDLKINIEK